MKELGLFIFGIIIGFFGGSLMIYRYMKTKHTKIVQITREDALDIIETDEQIKKLKKELHL